MERDAHIQLFKYSSGQQACPSELIILLDPTSAILTSFAICLSLSLDALFGHFTLAWTTPFLLV
jgi:hypothetical protein